MAFKCMNADDTSVNTAYPNALTVYVYYSFHKSK